MKLPIGQLDAASKKRGAELRARFGGKIRKKGDPQTPMMLFSSKITWLSYQLKGSVGNIHQTVTQIEIHRKHVELPWKASNELKVLLSRANKLAQELRALDVEVAEFNRTKNKRRV
jgi:hypothetical protein